MPFYDFACKSCGEEFNISATMKSLEEKSIPCPHCGSRDLARVYKSVNVLRPSPRGIGVGACGDKPAACPHSGSCGCCRH